ncbi:MAG TPA: hypothetical protein VN650_02815 [Gemmatimonadaceae bacterium]|nr:hypothetical protein [Gemmatimonadaceae bacterium]
MPDERMTPGTPAGDAAASEVAKLWLSWAWVGIPGLWGVYHVVVDALKIFK